MKGLELSKKYYEAYGRDMLHGQFPELEGILAVGLAGSGSECFGYDDAVSRDHDFEPGFCIFIPDEDVIDERTEFRLQRAYAHLPKEFLGYRRQILSPVGGNRHGVLRMRDFFISKCGSADGQLSLRQWLLTPEYALAEAVNGEVFRDDSGSFTAVRKRLACYPEDIRRKKLAGYLLTMAQAGQYNYSRCVFRGETGAAQLAAGEFVNAVLHVIFLLNKVYMPYYKWSFRALRELERHEGVENTLSHDLEYLISSGNSAEEAEKKDGLIGKIAECCIEKLREQALISGGGTDLERHAYAVNDTVADSVLRNMNVFAGV